MMILLRSALVFVAIVGAFSSVFSQSNAFVSPAETIQQADVLYDSGRYSDAISLLQTISARDTAYNHIDRVKLLAYAYVANEQYDSAIQMCTRLLRKPSVDRSMLIRIRALATEKKGAYKEAVALYNEGIKEYPTDINMIFGLATIQYNNKEYEASRDNLLKVLSINPFCSGCHLNLAKLGIGQGMKVHAMLAMGMYLGINEKDNSNLVLINKFLDNQVGDEGSLPVFGTNAAEKLDQIIRARLVNEEGYKSAFPISAAVVRQYELFFNQLESIPSSTDDKYVEYYLPIYKAIKDNGSMEAFIYHILTSTSIDDAHKWLKKNDKALKAFYGTVNEVLKSKRANIVVPGFNYKSPVNAWYDGNQLASIGKYENEKRKGHWVYLHSNSEKMAEGDYTDDGVKKGTWKYYYDNGRTKSVENYDTNEVTLYARETGNKAEHFFLKDDKIHGEVELFYESGGIREKIQFVDGKRHGIRKMFFPDGKLKAQYEYKEGTVDGPYLINNEAGGLKEKCSYKAELLDGKYEYYHFNGTLGSSGTYAGDKQVGLWEHYFSNGKLQRKGSYNAKGNPIGEWQYFNTAGELVEKRNFDDNGQYQGENSFYYHGRLVATDMYKKDILVKLTYFDEAGKVLSTSGSNDGTFTVKNYFPTGELRSEGAYKKGKSNGEWKFYNRYGALVSKYLYKNNQLNGLAFDYYPTGEKKYEIEYKDGEQNGYFKEYFRNGKVKLEGWVRNGNREQRWLNHYSDGTIESDYYYVNGEQAGLGINYAVDGSKYYEVNVNDEGISMVQYYNSKGAKSSSMRKENNTLVIEEFFKNKKLKSRHDVAGGSYVRAWEQNFPNGELYYRYELANGKIHGKYIANEIDGRLGGEGHYALGQKEGNWKRYHENGKISSIGNYLNDERDSVWTYYYFNGTLSSRSTYLGDEKEGVSTYYAPDGTPVLQKLFAMGDVIAYRPYAEGESNAWTKFTGTGKIVAYYPNSTKVASEEEYMNGKIHGLDRLYYPSGQLYSEFHYVHGDLNGDYVIYYSNGKAMEKGTHKEDEYHGKVEMFNEDGSLARSLTYHLGYRHGKATLYKKGVKLKDINFWNGVIED